MLRGRFALVASVLGLTLLAQSGFGQAAPAAPAAPATPPAPPAVWATPGKFNVKTQFGAKADGTTKDTAAFQKALDTCAVNGGGDVIVPAGTYLIGSIQIGNKTTLRLEEGSVLQGSPDIEADYPMCDVRWEGRWLPGHRGLVYASAVDHIGIVGPGKIIGSPWGTNGPGGIRNPVVIEPISCNDVTWDGFTVQQGGHWATHPTYCNDIKIRNVNITGQRDGIDVDSCKGVLIDHCIINAGDDCISLKSGRGMDGARLGKATEDVVITNCELTGGNFACLGVGSETSGGVRNVRMEHCKLTAMRSQAIYIKTRIGRAGGNENIFCNDLDVTSQIFLRINLTKGGNTSTADDPVDGLAGYPYANNFKFTNIRINATAAAVTANEISAFKPMEGLVLENITGTAKSGINLANIKGVTLKDIKITGFDTPMLSIANVQGTGLEGAVQVAAPVDPPPGNARGGFTGVRGGAARGGPDAAGAPGTAPAAGGRGGRGRRGGGGAGGAAPAGGAPGTAPAAGIP